MNGTFEARLDASQRRTGTVLCVGLDPDPDRLPAGLTGTDGVVDFCFDIIDATAPHASAYKVNFAFFEALGDDGVRALRRVRTRIPDGIPAIADAKRGDIGNSARFYARSVLVDLGFDAVTVSPYMGEDSVAPFLEHAGTATFVLARTSNPGREDFQDSISAGEPLYIHVARRAARWHARYPATVGLVAGATDPDAMARLRSICPGQPFLVPGVGAQGGDPGAVLRAGWGGSGSLLVNSSRGILYASSGPDFARAASEAARSAAELLPLPS